MPYHADIHHSVDPIVNSSEARARDLMGQVSFKGYDGKEPHTGTMGILLVDVYLEAARIKPAPERSI
jgi:hypothetical protein